MSLLVPYKLFFTAGKLIVLVAALFLFNCKGKDGDIGPAGPAGADGQTGAPGMQGQQGEQGPEGRSDGQGFENGFIKGTIKGKRRNDQVFQESFEFKLADRRENFTEPDQLLSAGVSKHILDIYRFNSIERFLREENNANIQLIIENKGQANQQISTATFKVDFSTLLADQNLFVFRTYAYFQPDEEVMLPISRTANTTYKLADYGRSSRYVYDENSNQSYLEFNDQSGNKIYFEPQEDNEEFYKFAFVISPAGVRTVTSPSYSGLLVKRSYSEDFAFFDASFQDLSEKFVIPADLQEITNFVYDPATGLVTFDFKIIVDQFRNENTSRNQVEISGSVKSSVYNNIVMREGSE